MRSTIYHNLIVFIIALNDIAQYNKFLAVRLALNDIIKKYNIIPMAL